MSRREKVKQITRKWRYAYRKIGITKRLNFEDIKQKSQSSMVEVKESTYEEVLLMQIHLILGIWILLKVFTGLYCLF